MAQGFQIISARLFPPEMCVDAHVPSGTGERLAFPVRNVLFGLGIPVLFCHTKIDDMNDVGTLRARATNEEVVGLDVPVDEVLLVDCLYPRKLGMAMSGRPSA